MVQGMKKVGTLGEPVVSLVGTYEDVVLDPDHVAAPEVGGGEGRHEQLLRLPVIRLAGPDLAARHRSQLPRLRLHHLVLCDVLDCLQTWKVST